MTKHIDDILAGVLLGLLISLAALSCLTPRGGSIEFAKAAESIYRLKCVCGAVAWVRVETEPRLRVTITSNNAPLGIIIQPFFKDIYILRCTCGFTHYMQVKTEPEIQVGIIRSEPPPIPPGVEDPPVIEAHQLYHYGTDTASIQLMDSR